MTSGLQHATIIKVFRLHDGILERLSESGQWCKVVYSNNIKSRYTRIRFNEKIEYLHRVLWVLYHEDDIPEDMQIDHINGNAHDNTEDNLRLVCSRANAQNLNCHRRGKLSGAYYSVEKHKWCSKPTIQGATVHLGYFITEEQAHEAYLIAVSMVHMCKDPTSFRVLVRKVLNDSK
jgi:hypothetical protein